MGFMQDKVELFSGRVVTETIRQWLVLLSTIWLVILLNISWVVIIRNSRKIFSSDVLMLLLIQIRIVLLMIFEFLVPNRFLVFLGELFYLVLLTIIFLMFIRNISSIQHNLTRGYKLYFGCCTAIILAILVMGIIEYEKAFDCSKNSEGYTQYPNHILHGLELLLVSVNLFLTFVILKKLQRARNERRLSNSQIDADTEYCFDVTSSMKQSQVKMLSISLFIFTLLRVTFSLIGDEVLFKRGGFEWKEPGYYRPQKDISALYLFITSFASIFPAFFLLYIIFWIPKKEGKLSMSFFQKEKLRINKFEDTIKSTSSYVNNDIDVSHITSPFLGKKRDHGFPSDNSHLQGIDYSAHDVYDRNYTDNGDHSHVAEDFKSCFEERMKSAMDKSVADKKTEDPWRNASRVRKVPATQRSYAEKSDSSLPNFH